MLESLVVRRVAADEVDAAYAIEALSYPSDEAASHEMLRFRQREAGEYFLGAFSNTNDGNSLVAFVCGTRCAEYNEHSFKTHDPAAPTLCLHSVVVHPQHRKQGIASKLVLAFVHNALVLRRQRGADIAKIVLLSKSHNCNLYSRCGFQLTRPSPVEHGKDLWMEMELNCAVASELKFTQVDAFAETAFKGNPAAVVVLSPIHPAKTLSEEWMQDTAAEMNLSETSFLEPQQCLDLSTASTKLAAFGSTCNSYKLRWFTPVCEVGMCGHATLAAAHVLFNDGLADPTQPIEFTTKGGVLLVHAHQSQSPHRLTLQLPSSPPTQLSEHQQVTAEAVCATFGFKTEELLFVGKNTTGDLLVETTAAAFGRMPATPQALNALCALDCRGVTVCCWLVGENNSSNPHNAHAAMRFFAPACGIAEDPVTGSAMACVCPYFASRVDQGQMILWQASKRGGLAQVECQGERVAITTTCFTTMCGVLFC